MLFVHSEVTQVNISVNAERLSGLWCRKYTRRRESTQHFFCDRNSKSYLALHWISQWPTQMGGFWDFDDVVMRDRARQRLLTERPMLLSGSPMCTAFSTWQRISNKIRDPVTVKKEFQRAKQHLGFRAELYREQAKAGRYFLHEPRPTPAPGRRTSWRVS